MKEELEVPIRKRFLSDSFIEKLQAIEEDSIIARKLLTLSDTHLDNEYVRNVTLRDDGLISYLPKGKEAVLTDDLKDWTAKNRMQCKPGRFVKQWAEDWCFNFYDADVEKFVNQILSEASSKFDDFKIVSGDEIVKYYHESNYDTTNSTGTLSASCMRYTGSLPLIKFYAKNPHRIRMVVLKSPKNSKKIIGRAILWETNHGSFVDRVYASDSDTERFKKFSKFKGFAYKMIQNRTAGDVMMPDRTILDSVMLTVTDLEIPKDLKMPYFDTLYSVHPSIGMLAGSCMTVNHFAGHAQSQSGGLSNTNNLLFSNYHNLFIPKSLAQRGYESYTKKEQGQVMDYFYNNDLDVDSYLGERYLRINMVRGIDGHLFVKDNPHITMLTGGKLLMPCLTADTETCFFDKKVYHRSYHLFRSYNIKDVSAKTRIVKVFEPNAIEFLNKYDLSVDKKGIINIPEAFDVFFRNEEVQSSKKQQSEKSQPAKKVEPDTSGQEIIENPLFGIEIIQIQPVRTQRPGRRNTQLPDAPNDGDGIPF